MRFVRVHVYVANLTAKLPKCFGCAVWVFRLCKGKVMIVEKQKIAGCTLLTVEGVVKLGQSARFLADALKRALAEEEGHVLIDLADINYIDSTGIGELVGYLVKFQERRRKLILVRAPKRIRKLLEVTGVIDMFPMYDDPEEAVAAES